MKSSFGITLQASNAMDVPADVLNKMERYCAFQERSEVEVRKKLCATPLSSAQRDEIIRRLKENDFLNEARFVEIFTRSKIKDQWGKYKIRQALFEKGIPTSMVDEAMAAIDEELYAEMLNDCIEKWKRLHPEEVENRNKMMHYLLSRGFATDEIIKAIR